MYQQPTPLTPAHRSHRRLTIAVILTAFSLCCPALAGAAAAPAASGPADAAVDAALRRGDLAEAEAICVLALRDALNREPGDDDALRRLLARFVDIRERLDRRRGPLARAAAWMRGCLSPRNPHTVQPHDLDNLLLREALQRQRDTMAAQRRRLNDLEAALRQVARREAAAQEALEADRRQWTSRLADLCSRLTDASLARERALRGQRRLQALAQDAAAKRLAAETLVARLHTQADDLRSAHETDLAAAQTRETALRDRIDSLEHALRSVRNAAGPDELQWALNAARERIAALETSLAASDRQRDDLRLLLADARESALRHRAVQEATDTELQTARRELAELRQAHACALAEAEQRERELMQQLAKLSADPPAPEPDATPVLLGAVAFSTDPPPTNTTAAAAAEPATAAVSTPPAPAAAAAEAAATLLTAGEFREWRFKTGRLVRARLIRRAGADILILEYPDRRRAIVSRSALSGADNAYLDR